MKPTRTLVIGTLLVLTASFAVDPASAAGALVNGDFETDCSDPSEDPTVLVGALAQSAPTGWEWAPWEEDWAPVNPAAGVFPLIGTDGSCGLLVLDQTTLTQTVEGVDGENVSLSFDANVLPVVTDLNSAGIISYGCRSALPDPVTGEFYLVTGRVVLEFLNASALPGEENFTRTVGASYIEVTASGSYFAAAVAPLGTDYIRVKVSGCAALSGVVYDNFVLGTF